MKFLFVLVITLLWTGLAPLQVHAIKPYLELEAAVMTRDVIEEGEDLTDFKIRGDAVSTHLTTKLGVEIWDTIVIYLQAGGANLKIEEFSDYRSSFEGVYGTGFRLYLYRSLRPNPYSIFLEAKTLWFETDDKVQIEELCSIANGCTSQPDEFLPRLAEEMIDWKEYTLLMGASSDMGNFDFYGGVRLSWVHGEDSIEAVPDGNFSQVLDLNFDLSEDDNFGLFFGTDIPVDRMGKLRLNFEVSLIDEDSFHIAIRRIF